ncbi:dihydrolipoyl dehydrogenase [Kamptonema cortianum]|jgi:dihydrolipoamide dehydrogenase|nr:dihydrolipoyl dehydrogenase [Geitlerinema splendidum]MDK3160029.1 dihydrolipoyl dehydrogenase [Kamptonema cortianum]
MDKNKVDLIIIGAGPGGYVAAIRAAQLGLSVLCVEKRKTLGGTCLNVGCIPSKALLYSSHKFEEAGHLLEDHGVKVEKLSLDLKKMMERKEKVVEQLTGGIDYLFKKNKIQHAVGEAHILSAEEVKVNGETWKTKNILIATGSESASVPGITIDEKKIVSSTGGLSLDHVPEKLVVIGGGYIGLEMGSVWNRLGSKVTVVEFMDRLVPATDHEMGAALMKALTKQGINFKLSTKVTGIKEEKNKLVLNLEDASGGKENLEANTVLVATGRKPYTHGLGLEKIGVALNEKGFIVVNERYETSVSGVYAIGDVIPGPMLAHKAEEEGIAAVEIIAGQAGHVNYGAIPAVIYTHPEVASVGKTEEELKAEERAYKIGKFPFLANSRAKAVGDTQGFVKILADSLTDQVLGVHIIGPDAGTLIAEAVLGIEFSASAEDIARTCHAHPTLNEVVKEAAMAVDGRAIHI